jgi:hypothetical protein
MFIHEISHVAQALNTGGLIMKDGVLGTHLIHQGANIKYPDGSYIYPEWHDAYEEWEKQLPNQ